MKIALIGTLIIALAGISALLVNLSGLLQGPESSLGNQGPACNHATSSKITLGTGETAVAATSSSVSTTISTGNSELYLSFTDNIVPSSSLGIKQLSSTTVNYPSELYGSGFIHAVGNNGATFLVSQCQ